MAVGNSTSIDWGIDQRITGEIHFSWVLEGRAIQDVWIMPRRSDRTGTSTQGPTCDHVDQSRRRSPRAADRPANWRRCRADRHACRWYADQMDVHRHHTEFVPLAEPGARSGRQDVASGRGVSRSAYCVILRGLAATEPSDTVACGAARSRSGGSLAFSGTNQTWSERRGCHRVAAAASGNCQYNGKKG